MRRTSTTFDEIVLISAGARGYTNGKFGWGVFYVAGGVIAFLFLLIKWLGNNDFVKFGFYISILASLGLAVGGFLTAKERGDLAALQNRGAGGTGGGTPPPSPPSSPPPA